MKKLSTNFLLLIFVFLSGYSQSYASLQGNDVDYYSVASLQEFFNDDASLDKGEFVINPIHSYEHNNDYVFEADNEEEDEEVELHQKNTKALGVLTSVFTQEPNLGFVSLISATQKSFSYVSSKRYLLFCVIRI